MSFPYLQPWLVVQAASWLCVLALAGLTGTAPAPAVTAVLVWLVLSYAALWRILGAGGTVADRVTLLRFVALLVAGGLIAGSGRVTWPAWLVLVAAAFADLLDGYCARRFGGSAGGAILDMETDQFAFVVLALLALLCPKAPAYVLALPALRYVKVLAHAMLGLPAHAPRPLAGDNAPARRACALATGLLLVSLVPAAPSLVVVLASAAALVTLLFSYRTDLADLVAARAAAKAVRPG